MNPFSTVSWVWKALRGHSVTFAALFAFTILGLSVVGWLKSGLSALGFGWLGLLVLPTAFITWVARNEQRLLPDAGVRRRWARSLMAGALVIAVTMAFFKPKKGTPAPSLVEKDASARMEPADTQVAPESRKASAPIKPHGPSGK